MFTQMRHGLIVAVGVAVLMFTTATGARGEESNATTPFGQFMQRMNPANWRMPTLPTFRSVLPKTEEKARIRKKSDGLVDEVGKTAQNSWQRTKDALSPQRFAPNFFTASAKSPARTTPTKQRPGFFQSLFSAPEAPLPPKDPSGFLNQPRVQP